MISPENFKTLLNLYYKKNNDKIFYTKEDSKIFINLLLKIPFFNKICIEKGFMCLKNFISNMKIERFDSNSIIFIEDKINNKYQELLIGDAEKSNQENTIKCISPCYLAVLDLDYYTKNIHIENPESKKKFFEILFPFTIFNNLTKNILNEIYYCYEEISYSKNEIIYKENSVIDGIFLVIKGEFLISKNKPVENINRELSLINDEIAQLRKKSSFLITGYSDNSIFNYKQYFKEINKFSKNRYIKINSTDREKIFNKNFNNKKMNLIILKSGDFFGEYEYLNNNLKRRTYSVNAIGDYENILWYISPKTIANILNNKKTYEILDKLSKNKFKVLFEQYKQNKSIENIQKNNYKSFYLNSASNRNINNQNYIKSINNFNIIKKDSNYNRSYKKSKNPIKHNIITLSKNNLKNTLFNGPKLNLKLLKYNKNLNFAKYNLLTIRNYLLKNKNKRDNKSKQNLKKRAISYNMIENPNFENKNLQANFQTNTIYKNNKQSENKTQINDILKKEINFNTINQINTTCTSSFQSNFKNKNKIFGNSNNNQTIFMAEKEKNIEKYKQLNKSSKKGVDFFRYFNSNN